MLTELEVGQFHAFGYAVIRECLDSDFVRQIDTAYTRLIAKAPRYAYFDPNTATRMMTDFAAEDSVFSELIEHPKIMEAMRDIDGTEFLYMGACDIWSNLDDTPWHTDSIPGQEANGIVAKTAIYLDESVKDDGSLNLIAGSQHPQFATSVLSNLGHLEKGTRPRLLNDRQQVPGAVAVETNPGDVVIFNTSLFHSAWKRKDGKPRRNLFFSYLRDPRDDPIMLNNLLTTIRKSTSKKTSPYIYSKELLDKSKAASEKMATRLEELGVENVREK